MKKFWHCLHHELSWIMDNQTLTAQLDNRVIDLWLDSLDELHREALKPCEILIETYKVKNSLGILLQYRALRIECFNPALRNALMIGYRYYTVKSYQLGLDICFSVNGEWSVAYNGGAIARKPFSGEEFWLKAEGWRMKQLIAHISHFILH